MTGKTHMAIGAAAAVALAGKLGIDPGISYISGALLGSLILDLDHPKAMLNQRILPIRNKFFHMVFYISLGIFILTGGLGTPNTFLRVLSSALILLGISSHRSFTHSFLGLGAVFFFSYYLSGVYGYQVFFTGVIIGAILHLIADLFTSHGAELLYPISSKRISFPITISTGGVVDSGICVASIGFILLRMG